MEGRDYHTFTALTVESDLIVLADTRHATIVRILTLETVFHRTCDTLSRFVGLHSCSYFLALH